MLKKALLCGAAIVTLLAVSSTKAEAHGPMHRQGGFYGGQRHGVHFGGHRHMAPVYRPVPVYRPAPIYHPVPVYGPAPVVMPGYPVYPYGPASGIGFQNRNFSIWLGR